MAFVTLAVFPVPSMALAQAGRSAGEVRGLGDGSLVESAFRNPLVDPGRNLSVEPVGGGVLIERPDGSRAVLHSNVPFRDLDAAGRLAPVSLRLVSRGGRFEPENALTTIEIGRRADEPIAFSDVGLTLVPLAGARSVPMEIVDDVLVGAGAVEDVSLVVAPRPRGVKTSYVLWSKHARTQLVMDFGFAQVAASSSALGTYDVSIGGQVRANVGAPTAVDADGHAVPIQVTVEAGRLVMDVDVSGASFPVAVDPTVDIFNFTNRDTGSGQVCRADWTAQQPAGEVWEWCWQRTTTQLGTAMTDRTDTSPGLYAFLSAPGAIGNNHYVQWLYRPPRPRTIVGSYQANNISHVPNGAWSLTPPINGVRSKLCMQTGVYSARYNRWETRDHLVRRPNGSLYSSGAYGNTYYCNNDSGLFPNGDTVGIYGWSESLSARSTDLPTAGNVAVFKLEIPPGSIDVNGQPTAAKPPEFNVSIGQSIVELTDDNLPTLVVDPSYASYAAWRPTTTGATTAYASDDANGGSGLGMKDITLTLAKGDGTSESKTLATATCGGTHTTVCPVRLPASGYTSSTAGAFDVPEGETTATVAAKDILAAVGDGGHTTTQSFPIRVDATAPEIRLGGTLPEADGAMVSGSSYTIDPVADDTPDGGVNKSAGIKKIEIYIDKAATPAVSQDFACSTTCLAERILPQPYVVTTAVLGDGDHSFEVRAIDAAGNESRDSFDVKFVRVTPRPPINLDLSNLPSFRGPAAGDRAGESVASVGDVDGDGYEDVLIGAPGTAARGRSGAGAAYLVRGGTGGFAGGNLSPSSTVIPIWGAAANDRAGTAVAAAGDVNDDGFKDLLVGAPANGAAGVALQGKVHVIYGSSFFGEVDLAALGGRGMTIIGPLAQTSVPPTPDVFGSQLGSRRLGDSEVAGDVNGDGRDDIVIGSPEEDGRLNPVDVRPDSGTTYVVFGRQGGGTVDTSSLGSAGYRIVGAAATERSGSSVTFVGDVNDDQLADIALVAPNAPLAGRLGSGVAYIVYGKTGTADIDLNALGSQGFRILGAANDHLSTVASVGDIDSDSNPDIVLGGTDAIALFVQPVAQVDLAGSFSGYRMLPPASDAGLAEVASAGDHDGDGGPDVVVSYPATSKSYIVLGQQNPGATLSLASLGGQQGARLTGPAGSSVGRSADGATTTRRTALIGAPDAAPNGAASGQAAVVGPQSYTVTGPCVGPDERAPVPFIGNSSTLIKDVRVLPPCRTTPGGIVDAPAFAQKTVGSAKFQANPACLRDPETQFKPTCRSTAIRGGNARLNASVSSVLGTRIAMYDSFEGRIVTLQRVAFPGRPRALCFEVYRGSETTNPAGRTCDLNSHGIRTEARVNVAGKQCMVDEYTENQYYLVRLLDRNDGVAGNPPPEMPFRELQGFVKTDQLTLRGRTLRGGGEVYSPTTQARRAYTGCGSLPLRDITWTRSNNLPAGLAPISQLFGYADRYVSNSSYESRERTRGTDPNWNQPYGYGPLANYQVPTLGWTDPTSDVGTGPGGSADPRTGAAWAALTISTTAVSGLDYRAYGQRLALGGGLVRAIVPRSRPFNVIDGFDYSDTNTRCNAPRVARWYLGAANPAGDAKHKMVGWTARRAEDGVRAC